MKHLIYLLILQSQVLMGQGVIQNSVFKGLTVGISFGANSLNSETLSKTFLLLPELSLSAHYGIHDKWGLYARAKVSKTQNIPSTELFFQFESEAIAQYHFSGGLFIAPGSNLKNWRTNFSIGISGIQHHEKMVGLLDELNYNIQFSGIGLEATGGIYFFPKPFLSFSFHLSPSFHNINRAEYLGQIYKENYSMLELTSFFSLSYHFNGR